MHRIDTATATPDHKFTEGDPAVPVAATTVSAEWLNAVQEELVAVITGAGLELKKSDNGQLWQAIGQLITNAKPGLATKAKPGLVQVGGGLDVTAQGLLSVLTATLEQNGIMRPDGTTCTVENGVLKVLQQTSDYMEEWRKSWIGVPRYWRSTTLPANHCWANGDAVLFADWPELKAVYDAGGFEGMLLPWDASSEQQAANLGKWRPNALNPTGLFTPNLSAQFFRNWGPGDGACGQFNKPGLPNIVGNLQATTSSPVGGAFRKESIIQAGAWNGNGDPWRTSFDASRCSSIYGTSDTVMPPSINQPVILYLGRPAQV
ncbi:hypothetical protein [Desulfovibrio legallii]|uniref:hypothetical protein n=1 Tax=Desulfovibrio legallii TaxID=571438 RepID=UPI000E4883D0|nr:hypothetical protein [Desulfovibrio legallii]RHH23401.1 hypothetical protein DW219_05800 [Desulfovibrio sp. AM18-2]